MRKTADYRFRVEPELLDDFVAICKAKDMPAAQVLRHLMRQYIDANRQDPQPDMFREATTNEQQQDHTIHERPVEY